MIQLDHVTKLYGQVIGVNDMTAELPPGGYGLLGPNGSGKSTLLNLVTGQLVPTLGTVRVLDCNPAADAAILRHIGYCPEQDLLYANVTGLEWVTYLVRLHGISAGAERRAQASLERVGLAPAMRRRMGEYSRGMRQRAKLAQALAHDPELLILDEPLNGLDPIGRHEITVLLQDWIRAGKGLVLASHILHEVEAVTQSFLLICNGRLLASGSAAEVHALLADVPCEVRIESDQAPALARRLLDEPAVESLKRQGTDLLLVGTRSPAALYAQLPAWAAQAGASIRQLRSSDESLADLFGALLRIHRGRA